MSKAKKKPNSVKLTDGLVSLELETFPYDKANDNPTKIDLHESIRIWGNNSVYDFDDELKVEDCQAEDEREYELKTQTKLKRCLYEVYIGLFRKRQYDTEETFLQRVNDFRLWLDSKRIRKELEYIDSVNLSYAQDIFHGLDREVEDCYSIYGYYYTGSFNYLHELIDLSDEKVRNDFWDYTVYKNYLERIDIVESYCDDDFDYINMELSTLFFYISAKRVGESALEFSLRVDKLLNMKEIQDLRIWGKPLETDVM